MNSKLMFLFTYTHYTTLFINFSYTRKLTNYNIYNIVIYKYRVVQYSNTLLKSDVTRRDHVSVVMDPMNAGWRIDNFIRDGTAVFA